MNDTVIVMGNQVNHQVNNRVMNGSLKDQTPYKEFGGDVPLHLRIRIERIIFNEVGDSKERLRKVVMLLLNNRKSSRDQVRRLTYVGRSAKFPKYLEDS